MYAVVGGVAGDDQADGGHVQHRGVVGVGMSDFDRDQLLAFQVNPSTGMGW